MQNSITGNVHLLVTIIAIFKVLRKIVQLLSLQIICSKWQIRWQKSLNTELEQSLNTAICINGFKQHFKQQVLDFVICH